jgi:phenylalanyl-tRNA synthetase alpha chain
MTSHPTVENKMPKDPDSESNKAAALTKYADPKRYLTGDANCNVTTRIASLVGRGLHLNPNHPIGICRAKIEDYFAALEGVTFEIFDAEDPIVTATQCFDDLRIPPDHPSRSKSDTYWLTDTTLLRTHTSAHQSQHLRGGHEAFLCTGDVYRRDEVDKNHYPAFHQLEGVRLFEPEETIMNLPNEISHDEWVNSVQCTYVATDLKRVLDGLIDHLFGPVERRWNDEYFPFTEPSFEMEIKHDGEWREVLGCGVIHTEVLKNVGLPHRHGWAFGLGLERLAMILFDIPDIRLFWTDDTRFHSQFSAGRISKFSPYSKHPACCKDISFWLPGSHFSGNDLYDLVSRIAGDIVEMIALIDEFTHPTTRRISHCYRITYRSLDRTLTNDEINRMQEQVRDRLIEELGVEVRG